MAKVETKAKQVMKKEDFPYDWDVMDPDAGRMQIIQPYLAP